ncbi:Transposase [Catalinimonas alkaloidigena]|uniref:Transposase n=1 Tax=Catalinimonas alkaloidigena TaxID=1075417 RepID=A0A1G9W1R1_9BACT|nr:winged helix-turn-helix domain-containing protein [Catalinimonas alkaloidigena]SDM77985.1 Transposase [Catalinimonas alkaloidigena]
MKKGKNLDTILVLRRRAIELHLLGKPVSFIVEATGLSQPSVSRYLKAYRARGEASLQRPKLGGSQRKLSPSQLEQLVTYLDEGAQAHGFEGNLWSRGRVQQLITTKFGVHYQVRSVGDLLHHLGYSRQKPDRRSYLQDPAKLKQWREHDLPALKKSPARGLQPGLSR